MRCFSLLVLLVVGTTGLTGQSTFLPGYLQTTAAPGDRQPVLLELRYSDVTPTSIRYRPREDAPVRTTTERELEGFGFDAGAQYVVRLVQFETSDDRPKQVTTTSRDPEFEPRRVVLRVLLDGELQLFKHRSNGHTRYFARTAGGDLVPLVNRLYRYENQIKSNPEYLRTLKREFPPANGANPNFNFEELPLEDYLMAYARQQGLEVRRLPDVPRQRVRWGVSGGIGGVDLPLSGETTVIATDPTTGFLTESTVRTGSRPNQFGTRIALQTEVVLPNDGYAWSIRSGVHYGFYNYTEDADNELNVRWVGIPVGIRRYFPRPDRNLHPYVEFFGAYIQGNNDDSIIAGRRVRTLAVNTLRTSFAVRNTKFKNMGVGLVAGMRLGRHVFFDVQYSATGPGRFSAELRAGW